jgi:hypothetical protein
MWLFNLFKRRFVGTSETMDDPSYPFEVVTKATCHAILQPVVAASLASEGFEEAGPLRWVRSADAPIRQMFCFSQWKGGQIAPSWGLSLDFVPHIVGGRLKWHRTPKSAMLDLCVDSRDRALDIPYHHGPEPIRRRAPQIVPAAVVQATELWQKYRTADGLVEAFLWAKQYYAAYRGLGFYNMTQHPLALAFAYACSGDLEKANREIDEHGPGLDADEDAKLRQRLAAAAGQ